MPSAHPRRFAPAGTAPERSPARRLETWLWTGPLGHLLGGGVDFVRALAAYLLAQSRARSTARRQK